MEKGDLRTIILDLKQMHPNIAQLYIKKKYFDYNDPQNRELIGSASIVKMLVPKEILNELNIDPDNF